MKKKVFLFITTSLVVLSVHSQIKVGTDGHVSVGPVNPSSSYNLRIKAGAGYLDIGHPASSYASFITDRPRFYFNKGLVLANGALVTNTPSDFTFQTNGFGYPKMRIHYSSGYVGINKGPSSAQYHLDVGGYIRGTNLNPSDSVYKKEIEDLKDEKTSKIYQLKGKTYRLKNEDFNLIDNKNRTQKSTESDRQHIGFVAQDVQEVYPELVYQDSMGFLSLNYIEIIPLLVEALKNQNENIQKLEKEIQSLKTKEKSAQRNIDNLSDSDMFLGKNIPNPFSENTVIEFYLSESVEKAMLVIYDLQGKQVKSINIVEREYGSAVIYGSELQPGMYHYSLIADGEIIGIEKMILTD